MNEPTPLTEARGWAEDCDAHADNPAFSDGDRATYRYRARLLRSLIAYTETLEAERNSYHDRAVTAEMTARDALTRVARHLDPARASAVSEAPAPTEPDANWVTGLATTPQVLNSEREASDGDWEYKRCRHCRERIELVNYALGPKWMHWPTPYGNYRDREKYEHCRGYHAEPEEAGHE